MAAPTSIPLIRSKETPREILEADFRSLGGPLPIRGGWGYSREDACIIDKEMHTARSRAPFDVVGIEYVFVEKRIYEELIIFRAKDDRYGAIRKKLLRQSLMNIDDKTYDVLTFEISAIHDRDVARLAGRAPSTSFTAHDSQDASLKMNDELESARIIYQRDYWFDITSTFQ